MPKVLLNRMRDRSEVSTGRIGKVMEGVEDAATRRVHAAGERVEEVGALRMDVAPSRVPAGKDILVIEDLELPGVRIGKISVACRTGADTAGSGGTGPRVTGVL